MSPHEPLSGLRGSRYSAYAAPPLAASVASRRPKLAKTASARNCPLAWLDIRENTPHKVLALGIGTSASQVRSDGHGGLPNCSAKSAKVLPGATSAPLASSPSTLRLKSSITRQGASARASCTQQSTLGSGGAASASASSASPLRASWTSNRPRSCASLLSQKAQTWGLPRIANNRS